jgi:hypothetical protein
MPYAHSHHGYAGAFTSPADWPALPLVQWQPTKDTLHMWTQIVGKLRLELTPLVNHFWNVTLYVSSRGLTTSPIAYRDFDLEVLFDFLDHKLRIFTSRGDVAELALKPRSVADFYAEFMAAIRKLGVETEIHLIPQEVPDPIPFDQDEQHRSYDPDAAQRFWRVLMAADATFKEFRAGFVGKCSPVHFFWGSFDLAVTRFSGRAAPPRAGADAMTREAYSQEVSSVGWWPGGGDITDAAFYAYAAPEPEGFAARKVKPEKAFYHPNMHEFFLMYEDVRASASPRQTILDFAQSTYEAAADLGKWDRATLERPRSSS